MESRGQLVGRKLAGGGIEQKGERTHGHGQVWWLPGEVGVRRLNGNRKKYHNFKLKFQKKKERKYREKNKL